jgi:hypothetical protein
VGGIRGISMLLGKEAYTQCNLLVPHIFQDLVSSHVVNTTLNIFCTCSVGIVRSRTKGHGERTEIHI